MEDQFTAAREEQAMESLRNDFCDWLDSMDEEEES